MNPFNLLINYFIANSRASFYNVPGNQEITNTALLAGVVSENPLLSYLLIENKAKTEGDKFNASVASATATSAAANVPGLPAPATGPVVNPPTNTEAPTGSPATGTSTTNAVTLEAVKNEISVSNKALKEEFAKVTTANNAELTKAIAEKFDAKIAVLEKNYASLNDSILEIKKRLETISTNPLGPDNTLPAKGTANQKAPTKNEPK